MIPDKKMAIMVLRLTFGGSPGPFEWGVLSETMADLSNAILHNKKRNPLELHPPHQELVPKKQVLEENVPFEKGKELIVDIPINPKGMVDVYIDDTVGLTVDIPGSGNDTRLERAILLEIHSVARELHRDEPIPRKTIAALAKLLAEAGLEETKTIL